MAPMPPGNYSGWGGPPQFPMGGPSPSPQAMPQAMYDRPMMQRAETHHVPGLGRSRRTPIKPWMLVIGALVMAFLAFAVTRACIHTTTTNPATDPKPK